MSSVQSNEKSLTRMKMDTAKEKKDVADQAFKSGEVKQALRSYHEALMYLVGIDKSALQSLGMASPTKGEAVDDAAGAKQDRTEVDDMVEKIYANMSACHMKQGNWKRVVETADKALAKNENNYKAMFRKGKASGELGYFEKAENLLEELKKKNPSDSQMIDVELGRLRTVDRERQKAQDQKLRGFLSRDKKTGQQAATSTT